MKIIMAGATGLIGGLLLPRLVALEAVETVTLVGRREVTARSAKIVQRLGNVEDWPELVRQQPADIAVSTLGTTLRQAGSKRGFAAIDLDAVAAFAGAAWASGARQFMMVSSVGADAGSSNFYLATKGRAEAAVRAMGFDRVDFFRPGLLRGERRGEARLGERIGIAISPLTDRITPRRWDKFRSIAADDVAEAMAACVGSQLRGDHAHENRQIWAMA